MIIEHIKLSTVNSYVFIPRYPRFRHLPRIYHMLAPAKKHASSIGMAGVEPQNIVRNMFDVQTDYSHHARYNKQHIAIESAGLYRHDDMRSLLLFFVLIVASLATAAKQPTSYCKCICFQNSTIIPLNSSPSESAAPSTRAEESNNQGQDQHHHTLTCADCNRAFCLDYDLPICKNAKEEDVFAQCFRAFHSTAVIRL